MRKNTLKFLFCPSILSGILFFLVFIFVSRGEVFGQFAKDVFGKNRIQYRSFSWQYISTPNFEFYYYEGGEKIARMAAKFAEQDFPRLTNSINFSPYNKVKVFVYNTTDDLLQSNIGIAYQGIKMSGQTDFVRSEVELAFRGEQSVFRQELMLSVADVLLFKMMYGGTLKQVLQSHYLLSLPEWFMSGAANYIAYGWDSQTDDYIRSVIEDKKLRKLENLVGKQARLVGQSIWHYIVSRYGKTTMGHILNYTRVVRNERTGIENTLGMSYANFLREWIDYYRQQALKTHQHYENIPSDVRLGQNRKKIIRHALSLSPDGKYLAYTENRRGRLKVFLTDPTKKGRKKKYNGGYKVINQKIDKNTPLIAWINSQKLGVVASRKGKLVLWQIPLDTKKKTKVFFPFFSHITGFSFSEDGETMLLSATKNGQNDLFLYHLPDKRLRQLTNDAADDLDPKFFPGEQQIVFSSNRTDSLTKLLTAEIPGTKQFNLFVYDLQQKKIVRPLTKMLSVNRFPHPVSAQSLFFLSDRRGVSNLFKLNLSDSTTTQLTKFSQGIANMAVDFGNRRLYLIAKDKGADILYRLDNFDFEKSVFTPKTPHKQLIDLQILQAIRAQKKKKEAQKRPKKTEAKQITLPPDEIDTDNYRFDIKDDKTSFLARFKAKARQNVSYHRPTTPQSFSIEKPRAYQNRFTVDNFVTSLHIDPLRGWGLFFKVNMTDLLENHKINAGLFGLANLNNSNFFAEYEFLKYRLDFRAKFERHNLQLTTDGVVRHKYSMDVIKTSVSYPLNITTRLTFEPFYAATHFTNLSFGSLTVNDVVSKYSGFNTELVYDNSLITGVNMRIGTRAKVRLEKHFGLSDARKSFGNLLVDARHYQPLHRSLVLASRLSFGQFFGEAKKNYFLGGMGNWLSREINREGNKNPLVTKSDGSQDMTDLLFSHFATNLRGFELNKWYGQNYMLFNLELRFPILKYFSRRSIASNFFRNLQLTAFTDLGSSWTGLSPFNRANSLNTTKVKSGGFTAEVSNFKSPFLFGYGFGVRTMLLGYYTKLDVAWGLENKKTLPVKFYLTLGHDF